jgi:hypothetical protein
MNHEEGCEEETADGMLKSSANPFIYHRQILEYTLSTCVSIRVKSLSNVFQHEVYTIHNPHANAICYDLKQFPKSNQKIAVSQTFINYDTVAKDIRILWLSVHFIYSERRMASICQTLS